MIYCQHIFHIATEFNTLLQISVLRNIIWTARVCFIW